MSELTFGIRITADGRPAIVETAKVARGFDEIGDGAKKASGALDTFKGAFAALQVDRFVRDLVGSFADGIKQTINFAARLDDLADVTGSTVEDLSALANMAKFSGVSMGTLEQALARMSVRLSAADEDSKRAGAAIRALGVDARDPATALQEIADKLNNYADGVNKVAIVNEIFGRGAATQLLPLLKDLANETEKGTRVTHEQAKAAEDLEKNWASLSLVLQAFMNDAIMPVVKQINEYITATKAARQAGLDWYTSLTFGAANTGRLRDMINETTGEIDRLSKFINSNSWFVPKFEGDVNRARARVEELNKQLGVLRALSGDTGSLPNEGADRPRQLGQAPTVPGATRQGGGTRQDVVAKEFAQAMREAAHAIKEAEAASRELDKASKDLDKTLDKNTKGIAAWGIEHSKAVAAQHLAIRAYEDETKAIGATTDELEQLALAQAEYNRLQNEMILGADAAEEIFQRQTAAIRARHEALRGQDAKKVAEEQLKEQTRAAEQLEQTITDALMRGFEGGKDAGKNFFDSLLNLGKTLFLRPFIQSIAAMLTGGVSGGASAGGLGGLTGLFGGGSSGGGGGLNLGSLANLVIGQARPSWAGGFNWLESSSGFVGPPNPAAAGGSFFDTSGGLGGAVGGAGIGAGIGALLSQFVSERRQRGAQTGAAIGGAIGSFIPVIGTLIGSAIGAVVGSLFKSGGGPKSGGSASNIPGGERFFTPDDKDAQLGKIIGSQAAAYRQAVRALGGSGSAGFAIGFDTDPKGTAPNRVSAGATVSGRSVYSVRDVDVGRDSGALEERLALESRRALLAALQASELPAQIANIFNSVTAGSATSEQIDSMINFGSAMKGALDAVDGDVFAEAMKAWELSQAGVSENLREMGRELVKLAAEQDGSVESMQALSAATGNYRRAILETLVAIRAIGKQIGEMIASTREQVEFAGLGRDDAYNLARSRGNALLEQIGATDDPETVQRLSGRINSYFLAAFNLLSPEEQLAAKPEFLTGLATLETAVTTALARITSGITEDTGEPFAAVRTALDNAGPMFLDAAGIQLQAAEIIAGAATTLAGAVDQLVGAPPAGEPKRHRPLVNA